MRVVTALFTVAALAVGVVPAAASGSAQGSPTARVRSAGYTPPPLTWGSCDNDVLVQAGAQCATLVVPQNYARPGGTKIELAVSRVLHTTSDADYQGVMLTNPGGPGGSGLTLSTLGARVPHNGGAAYDWIGLDPRGVGASRPSLSCNTSFFHGDRPPYRPTTRRILRRWVARSQAYAADCATSQHSGLFRHLKTTDTVRDLESLRKALGQDKVNFYGYSWGTYLGEVYATLHPDRVRRFVWDATYNPQRVYYRSNQDQDVAFDRNSRIFFRWLAKYAAVYHVGDTPQEVRARYYRTVAALDRPGQAAGGVLGGDELTDIVTLAGYYAFTWEFVASAYSKYVNEGDASDLISAYLGGYNPGAAGADNVYANYLGVQCTDTPWPRSQARLNRDNRRLDRRYPFYTWANAWFNGPCASWQFPAGRRVDVTGAKVTVPILMIDETYDAAAPFSGSLEVRGLFPTASLVEGENGSTHGGSLSGVSCTDDTIAAYLLDGTVPTRKAGVRSDKLCPPVPQPDPTAPAAQARRANADAMPAALRETLQRAQMHLLP